MAVADLNGDGQLDIVTANYNVSNVSVLLGNGDGTFQSAVNYATGLNANTAVVADFNGDGIPDLAVANHGANNVSILLGNGDGTFQSPRNFDVGVGPYGVVAEDVNGDGFPDLVTPNGGSNNVTVRLNTGNWPTAPAHRSALSPALSPSRELLPTFPLLPVLPSQAERTPIEDTVRLEDSWTMPSPPDLFPGPFAGHGIPDAVIASRVDSTGVLSENGLDGWFQGPLTQDPG